MACPHLRAVHDQKPAELLAEGPDAQIAREEGEVCPIIPRARERGGVGHTLLQRAPGWG